MRKKKSLIVGGLGQMDYIYLNKNCLIYEKIGRLKKNQSKMLVF